MRTLQRQQCFSSCADDGVARLSHVNESGRARMVDVGSKKGTQRTATAVAEVELGRTAYTALTAVCDDGLRTAKGDVFGVAQLAGIMAAKRTPDLIPLCHSVPLSSVDVDLRLDASRFSVAIEVTARTANDARTGVEMEALTAASVAALTVYDMCKAAEKGIVLRNIHLKSKRGGKSDYDTPNRDHSSTSSDASAR